MFNLRLKFTGICTFVPNADAGRVRVCVLLPDGRSPHPVFSEPALDDAKLRRHVGFMSFPLKHLKGAGWAHEGDEVISYISNQRLRLHVDDDGRNSYDDDLQFVGNLEDIVPGFARVAEVHLADKPNSDPDAKAPRIIAQFLIDSGRLTTGDGSETTAWVFPGTIAGKSLEKPLASEVCLEFEKIKGAALRATAFEGTTSRMWHFEGEESEWVEVTISNLCDENPLRWKTNDYIISPDGDFRWHYHLLERRQDLKDALYSLDLPVPHIIKGAPNGQGVNCPPGRAAASPLGHLDEFLDI